MSNFFILEATKEHFTNELFQDLRIVDDETSKKVHSINVFNKPDDQESNNETLRFNSNFPSKLITKRLFLTSNKLWAVFSEEVKKKIEKCSQAVVFFKADIQFDDIDSVSVSYYAAQIPVLREITDVKKSIFVESKRFEGQFSIIQKLELKDIENMPCMFRVFEYPSAILISEKLKKELSKQDTSSLKFTPVGEFNSFSF